MLQLLKKVNVSLIRLLEIFISYYFVAHIVSGVFLNVGLSQPDIRKTWLNRLPVPQATGVRLENNLDDLSPSTLYIHAIYLVTNTISHVAVGDISSVSQDEKLLTSFCIWLFTFFYAFCFANIASVVQDFIGSNFLSFHEKYHNVMSMIPKEKIPDSVLHKISIYYDYLWAKSQGFNEETEILAEIPLQIKYDLYISRYAEAIENSLIFKN